MGRILLDDKVMRSTRRLILRSNDFNVMGKGCLIELERSYVSKIRAWPSKVNEQSHDLVQREDYCQEPQERKID